MDTGQSKHPTSYYQVMWLTPKHLEESRAGYKGDAKGMDAKGRNFLWTGHGTERIACGKTCI